MNKTDALMEAVKMQGEQAVQLVNQNETLQEILKEMTGLKEEMDKTAATTKRRLGEVENLVSEIDKRVHIDDAEASEIKSIIGRQAHVFAKEYFRQAGVTPSDNLFASKKGQFIRLQHSHLKHHFNVTKYTHIKHTEAVKAFDFLKSLQFSAFSLFEIRETPKQKEIIALENGVA